MFWETETTPAGLSVASAEGLSSLRTATPNNQQPFEIKASCWEDCVQQIPSGTANFFVEKTADGGGGRSEERPALSSGASTGC